MEQLALTGALSDFNHSHGLILRPGIIMSCFVIISSVVASYSSNKTVQCPLLCLS